MGVIETREARISFGQERSKSRPMFLVLCDEDDIYLVVVVLYISAYWKLENITTFCGKTLTFKTSFFKKALAVCRVVEIAVAWVFKDQK
jgi:hypothetical protein